MSEGEKVPACGVNGSDHSEYGPQPAALRARTRTRYCLPLTRPGMVIGLFGPVAGTSDRLPYVTHDRPEPVEQLSLRAPQRGRGRASAR